MRELKFRALKKNTNEIVYFDLKHFLENDEEEMPGSMQYVLKNIMQFTGLKDRNGKDIYEGDILTFDDFEWNRNSWKSKEEWEHPKWVVEWNQKEACWDTGGGTTKECSSYKEVIGNIYENPELLTN